VLELDDYEGVSGVVLIVTGSVRLVSILFDSCAEADARKEAPRLCLAGS
jgi:hypothetical protein